MLAWRGGDPPGRIAPAGSILDADLANLNGGSLRVAFTQNGTATDQRRILADGIVSLANGGTIVAVNGIAIGTVSGGGNGAALVIGFTSDSATPANVQAVLDHIGYASTAATTATRQVTFTLNDGDGTANGDAPEGSDEQGYRGRIWRSPSPGPASAMAGAGGSAPWSIW